MGGAHVCYSNCAGAHGAALQNWFFSSIFSWVLRNQTVVISFSFLSVGGIKNIKSAQEIFLMKHGVELKNYTICFSWSVSKIALLGAQPPQEVWVRSPSQQDLTYILFSETVTVHCNPKICKKHRNLEITLDNSLEIITSRICFVDFSSVLINGIF